MGRIVVVGSYNTDLTVFAESLPGPGETVLGGRLVTGPGGKGANQAIGASRLGADVAFVCKLGRDRFGADARELFIDERIDGPGVLVSDHPTGTALIVVDAAGENQIAVAPGANRDLHPDDIDPALFAGCDVVLVQLEIPLDSVERAVRVGRQAGAMIVLNPAPARALDPGLLQMIDVVTPNEVELATMTASTDVEAAAAALLGAGIPAVVVTRGAHGAVVVTAGGVTPFAALTAAVVDTTGAGDAFNAGLAVALSEGSELGDAIELGMRAAAYCVTREGVLAGLPTRSELIAGSS